MLLTLTPAAAPSSPCVMGASNQASCSRGSGVPRGTGRRPSGVGQVASLAPLGLMATTRGVDTPKGAGWAPDASQAPAAPRCDGPTLCLTTHAGER